MWRGKSQGSRYIIPLTPQSHKTWLSVYARPYRKCKTVLIIFKDLIKEDKSQVKQQ